MDVTKIDITLGFQRSVQMYILYCMHTTAFLTTFLTNKISDIELRILGVAAHAHKCLLVRTNTQQLTHRSLCNRIISGKDYSPSSICHTHNYLRSVTLE